jgi:ubiquinone biosynthesis accessory factor UbiK
MTSERQSILNELQSRLTDLFRASPAADIERNMKAMLNQTFQRLHLVTREEFDIQRELLVQLRGRVAELERRLSERDAGASR